MSGGTLPAGLIYGPVPPSSHPAVRGCEIQIMVSGGNQVFTGNFHPSGTEQVTWSNLKHGPGDGVFLTHVASWRRASGHMTEEISVLTQQRWDDAADPPTASTGAHISKWMNDEK